jgi:hypothetical protein
VKCTMGEQTKGKQVMGWVFQRIFSLDVAPSKYFGNKRGGLRVNLKSLIVDDSYYAEA